MKKAKLAWAIVYLVLVVALVEILFIIYMLPDYPWLFWGIHAFAVIWYFVVQAIDIIIEWESKWEVDDE